MALGAYRDKAPSQVTNSGYVVDSLEAGLWSVSTTDSFEAALLHVVHPRSPEDCPAPEPWFRKP